MQAPSKCKCYGLSTIIVHQSWANDSNEIQKKIYWVECENCGKKSQQFWTKKDSYAAWEEIQKDDR